MLRKVRELLLREIAALGLKVKLNGDTDSTSISPEPVPIGVEDKASE
jgi:hypothetical protein